MLHDCGMAKLPIFIEFWQIESGPGLPPAVGDQVEWGLHFIEHEALHPPHGAGLVTLEMTAMRHDRQFHLSEFPTRLDSPGMAFYWDAPRDTVGPVTVTGGIFADWHDYVPVDFPATRGIVRSLAIEKWHYRASGDPADPKWVRYGEPWYEPATTRSNWFEQRDSEPPPDHQGPDGFLAEVELGFHDGDENSAITST
jgi:hypothetical protein